MIKEDVLLREQMSQQFDALVQIKVENKRLRNENNVTIVQNP